MFAQEYMIFSHWLYTSLEGNTYFLRFFCVRGSGHSKKSYPKRKNSQFGMKKLDKIDAMQEKVILKVSIYNNGMTKKGK